MYVCVVVRACDSVRACAWMGVSVGVRSYTRAFVNEHVLLCVDSDAVARVFGPLYVVSLVGEGGRDRESASERAREGREKERERESE